MGIRRCMSMRLPGNKGVERSCTINAAVTCVEVAVDTRFCNVDSNDIRGEIQHREHLDRTNEDGEVCVFKNCNVPATWTTPEGSPIDPNSWCYQIAVEVASDTITT